MGYLAILFLTVTIAKARVVIESDDPTESLIWPTEYHFRGQTNDVADGIIKPFEIWYSAQLNISRRDYHDGTVSRYENIDEDVAWMNMIKVYKVYPRTIEDLAQITTCEMTIEDGKVIDFLPPVDYFTYYGEILYNDKVTKVWKSKLNHSNTNIETLYVYRDDSGVDVPVLYETKKYNKWTKALFAHTISEFYDYKLPQESALNVSNVKECEDVNIGADLKRSLHLYNPDIGFDLDRAFHSYKRHHNKNYKGTEHEMRRNIFQRNWRRVEAHNRKNLSYKMVINKFSDRTEEELAHLTATIPNPEGVGSVEFPHSEKEIEALAETLPENYNMKIEGVISNVKNQGSCGSCWAHATTAALEGAIARSNGGRNIDLSEQSLVDCAWEFENYGCDGGMMDRALKHVLTYGIPTQREYGPYLGENGYCALRNMSSVQRIRGFARVPPLSVKAMKVALYKYGPVAVAVHAGDSFKSYASGIFYDINCDGKHINHAVTVVGYGVRDGVDYWIVKNSYGEDWGQDGYMLISATNDNCFTLTEAYYPIV